MLAVPAYAATILAIVSPQNAPDVISGAHTFLQQNAKITIQIRTTEQWLESAVLMIPETLLATGNFSFTEIVVRQ